MILGLKVKVTGPERGKPFPDDNYRTLWPRIMQIDREFGHEWQMTPLGFGPIRSKVKVTGTQNSKIIFG